LRDHVVRPVDAGDERGRPDQCRQRHAAAEPDLEHAI
jgi:hypothetical protein